MSDVDRKKIGRKGDGIFRLKGDKQKGRKKNLNDSLKLDKVLRDMLVQLIEECNGDERIVRSLGCCQSISTLYH